LCCWLWDPVAWPLSHLVRRAVDLQRALAVKLLERLARR
jgi:hypothetical protein